MATLERAGYLRVNKSGHGRGATSSYRITKHGRAAYTRHVGALRAITGA